MANLPNGNIDFMALGDPHSGYIESAMLNGRYLYNPLAYDNTKSTVNLYINDVNNVINIPKGNFLLQKQVPNTQYWYDRNNNKITRSDLLNTRLLNDIYTYYDMDHYEDSGNLVQADNTIIIPNMYKNALNFRRQNGTSNKVIKNFDYSSQIFSNDTFRLQVNSNPSSKYTKMIISYELFIEYSGFDMSRYLDNDGEEYYKTNFGPSVDYDTLNNNFPIDTTISIFKYDNFLSSSDKNTFLTVKRNSQIDSQLIFTIRGLTKSNNTFSKTYSHIKETNSGGDLVFFYLNTEYTQYLKSDGYNWSLEFGIKSLEIKFE